MNPSDPSADTEDERPSPADLEACVQQLEGLGVTLFLQKRITAIDADGVYMGKERLEAKTVLWAAGVASSPLGAALGAPLDRAGRVKVARKED